MPAERERERESESERERAREREREKGPIQGEGPDQMHAPAACWDLSYPAATPQQIKSTTKTTNKGANRKEIREETTTT